jgi:caffeoyl-CoA O-methyltransferase
MLWLWYVLGAARLYTSAMDMTPHRWGATNEYLAEVFGQEDDHLAGLMDEAIARGLPDIAVSAEVGRLLMILTSMTRGRLAIEVGTLGGYSGIWIARGLAKDGRLITIEPENLHADFAQEQFVRAGVADRVDICRGAGLDILPRLAKELAPRSVDVVFLDAIKTEYPAYWEIVRPLIAIGGVIIADNVCGSSGWWIDDEGHESREGADRFNRAVARDPDFEAVAFPMRQGVLIGKRMK